VWTFVNTPKVVSGVDAASLQAVQGFYDSLVAQTVPVGSPKEAELTKLLENTFRHVNIALVNELAMFANDLGIDVWQAIDAASTKPFGYMRFTPGPGVGGHCIPLDPHYLAWKMRTLNYRTRFIELAGEINAAMPEYWVARVADRLNEQGKAVRGSKVLVLGVAYKKDIDDIRESPALDVIRLLEQRGAVVSYHDPHVAKLHEDGVELISVPLSAQTLRAADCVVVVTDHTGVDYALVGSEASVIVDTRHALPRATGSQS
jgi:UDP-N-acetyl-D-glucosamine dehydrogenase